MKNPLKIIFAAMIFAFSLALITVPNIQDANAILGNTSRFNVTLTLSNDAPTVSFVQTTSGTPSEGTTTVIQIQFNATDANGVSDIPATNANLSINYSGTTRTASSCESLETNGNTRRLLCNVTVQYFDPAGAWTVNASIYDTALAGAVNTTEKFTVNQLYAIALKTATISFSGSAGSSDVAAANNPQYINNTGNVAFNRVNLTAYNLKNGSNEIGAGNFSVNVTNNAVGHQLANGTTIAIHNSSLATQAVRDLYIYLDIPAGTPSLDYRSQQEWIINMN